MFSGRRLKPLEHELEIANQMLKLAQNAARKNPSKATEKYLTLCREKYQKSEEIFDAFKKIRDV